LRTVWFSWPNILILSPVPVATALVAWATWRASGGASQAGGFIGAVGLFALSYIGITISLFPMIVPHHYTLMRAGRRLTRYFLITRSNDWTHGAIKHFPPPARGLVPGAQ
jgi:cytochrome d ubiquinol oxidase subunit II